MKEISGSLEVKHAGRIKAVKYMLDHGQVSRQELASALGFSLPTVLQIVKDLVERGLICEAGEYGSTGGRRAKVLTIREGAFCVAGVEVTKNYLQMVLLDLTQNIIDSNRTIVPYENTPNYYKCFGASVMSFLKRNKIGEGNASRMLGVGISMPGIIDSDNEILRQSLTLGVVRENLMNYSRTIPYPVCFGNNTKSAAFAEAVGKQKNTVYLSLHDTVSGGAYIDGKIFLGDHFKGLLFGHMIIVPNGTRCYCGKKGCLNAYCAAQVLCKDGTQTLEQFFDELDRGNQENAEIWDKYLEYLAVAVSNLRSIFDCDIILGGDVSIYLEKYMLMLEEKVLRNIILEYDMSFVQLGKYKSEAFAVGAAQLMIDKSIQESDLLS